MVPELTLYTDASTLGWGAHLLGRHAQGVWTDAEQLHHITWLELEAVRRALLEFAVLVCNHSVLVRTDDSTDVSHIYRQGGIRALSLCILAWDVLRGREDRGVAPVSAPLPGLQNTLADALSRVVVRAMFLRWGTAQVDLFASKHDSQLPVFMTLIPDPAALIQDALSVSRAHLDA